MDIYGAGIRPTQFDDKLSNATLYRTNLTLGRMRITSGFNYLKEHHLVDPSKMGAIGYCFGGGMALVIVDLA